MNAEYSIKAQTHYERFKGAIHATSVQKEFPEEWIRRTRRRNSLECGTPPDG